MVSKLKPTFVTDEFIGVVADSLATGNAITLTTAVASSTTYTDAQLSGLNYAGSQSATKNLTTNLNSAVVKADTNTIVIDVDLVNQNLNSDFQIATVLINATYKGNNILVGVVRFATPELFPAYDNISVYELEMKLYVSVSRVGEATINVSSAGMATAQSVQDLRKYVDGDFNADIARKTKDNIFTGTNTFNKKIIAPAGVQGNSDSATKLQSARNINGVSFDGTTDILIDPTTRVISSPTNLFNLSNGFYYNSGSTNTNAPSDATAYYTVEVIQTNSNGYMVLVDSDNKAYWTTKTANAWQSWKKISDDAKAVHNSGDEVIFGKKTFSNGIIASLTGNADTASKLQTPRNIGGVPFDGGSNIDLPGVNKAGNQDTSGRAANATNADHANNASNSDLATKAIALQTPRKINGTVFDGTADINILAANNDDLVHKSADENIFGKKTFTDDATFNKAINGFLKTRDATFRDFAIIASDMQTYAGLWFLNNYTLDNSPVGGSLYGVVEVIPAFGTNTGIIRYSDIPSWRNGFYETTVDKGAINGWHKIADDDSVLHNFGDETAAGFKKFSGNIATTSDNSMINGGGNNGDLAMVKTVGSPAYLAIGNFNQRFIVRQSNNAAISPSDTFADMFTVDVNGEVRAGLQRDLVPLDKSVVHNAGNETVGGDKSFTGHVNYTQPITGSFYIRPYPFGTIAEIAGKMFDYAGEWGVYSGKVSDLPQEGFAILSVYPFIDNPNSGFVTLKYTSGNMYFSDMNGSNVIWGKVARDNEVVHNYGNEVIGGDKTFTETTTFNQPIIGSLITKIDTFTSFSDVAQNMPKYAGYHASGTGYITDMPYPGWAIIHVQPYGNNLRTGIITLIYTDNGVTVRGHVNSGDVYWEFSANDERVVHNTGDENVNGVKTFTSTPILPAIEITAGLPYIDFHFNNDTSDYTSRIIEITKGELNINGVSLSESAVTASLNGNASSATKLATTRNINGVGFDGTSDITVDPVTRVISTEIDLFTLSSGFYVIAGVNSPNKPSASSIYFTVEVIQTTSNGFMRLVDHTGKSFWTTKDGGSWRDWHQDADDSKVVHNYGDEFVGGNKTFTGNNTLNGVTTVNAAKSSSPISKTITTSLPTSLQFTETAFGVMVYASGYGVFHADGTWKSLATLPAGITPPSQVVIMSDVDWAGVGGVTLRLGVGLKISIKPTGEIMYKCTSLKDNDNTSYDVQTGFDLSTYWSK